MLRKLIPAEPIERAVLGLLELLFSGKTDLEQDIGAAVERVVRRENAVGPGIDELLRERDASRRKIALAIETLNEAGMDAAAETVNRVASVAISLGHGHAAIHRPSASSRGFTSESGQSSSTPAAPTGLALNDFHLFPG